MRASQKNIISKIYETILTKKNSKSVYNYFNRSFKYRTGIRPGRVMYMSFSPQIFTSSKHAALDIRCLFMKVSFKIPEYYLGVR